MYEAAITLFESQVRIEQENNILKAVKEIGVDVNKEELLKALKYDREQYSKGYEDGIKEGAIRFAKRLCEYYDIDFERSGLIQHILAEIKERF